MKSAEKQIRGHFLGWQCRIRQIAMREQDGRPSAGMRPRVLGLQGENFFSAATLLLIPRDHSESTAFFRFQNRRTRDPRQARENGIAFLQASYYQRPEKFSDCLLGVFSPDSPGARRCLEEGLCALHFQQFSQSFHIICSVREISCRESEGEAALWHNRLFNPALTEDMLILGFSPDWKKSVSEPPPS